MTVQSLLVAKATLELAGHGQSVSQVGHTFPFHHNDVISAEFGCVNKNQSFATIRHSCLVFTRTVPTAVHSDLMQGSGSHNRSDTHFIVQFL